MKGREYEDHVAEVLGQLEFLRGARVERNKRLSGPVPGKYEIDIAFHFQFLDKLDFLLIVECKDWNKRISRPVVQNLANTRDAVGAQKAALAAPTSFSSQTVDVAAFNRIALWIIADGQWEARLRSNNTKPEPDTNLLFRDMRRAMVESFGLETTTFPDTGGPYLARADRVTSNPPDELSQDDPAEETSEPPPVEISLPPTLFGEDLAVHSTSAHFDIVSDIMRSLLENGSCQSFRQYRTWRDRVSEILASDKVPVSAHNLQKVMEAVACGDEGRFAHLLKMS